MLEKIRFFLRYATSWILIIGCISLIGFVLLPLLSEKYASIALVSHRVYSFGGYTIKQWYPLEITRRVEILSGEVKKHIQATPQIDILEKKASETLRERTNNFFTVVKEGLSTNTNKKNVIYIQDKSGIYQAQ